jgi:serine/threonine protein kinase
MARYHRAASLLASLSHGELLARWEEAALATTSIGGTSALWQVDGAPVFVKRIPLTDLERRLDNVRSTANLFALPTFYQYGVGSTGFGAWRELAAHVMTTGWVRGRQCASFPLMYHWRVLPGSLDSLAAAELEETVAYWGGSPAIRGRLEAIAESSASLVLFLEYIPHNLHEWLTSQATDHGAGAASAVDFVDRNLLAGVEFMNERGLLHFDAHFRNILTDGDRIYFSDFGLATSSSFDLSASEATFLATNREHDASYVSTQFVNWLVSSLAGGEDLIGFIRRCAHDGVVPREIPPPAGAIIARYAPIAVVMNEFYGKLHYESRATPYPVDEIRRVWAIQRMG